MEPEGSQRRIPWARILMEGCAIVASILLAFAIDAWWDGTRERARERTVLASLQTEFQANQTRLQSVLDAHEDVHEAAAILLSLSRDRADSPPPPSDSLADLLWTTFVSATSYNPTTGVLASLIASGELGLIENEELRTLLASWPGLVEDSAEDEAWVFRDVQDTYTPYLNANTDSRFLWSEGSSLERPPTPSAERSYVEILDDPEFPDLVSMRAYGARALLREGDVLRDIIARILLLVEEELR